MKEYTLRELCEKCGVSRRAVQWYEKHELVKPCGKNKMSYLLYDEDTAKKVTEIKALQDYGFSVAEIKKYFESEAEEQKEMLILKYNELRERYERMVSIIKEIELLIAKIERN